MGVKLHFFVLSVSFLTVLLAWSTYTPIPEGFSDPWGLRRLHILLTKSIQVARWLDFLGIKKFENTLSSVKFSAPITVDGVSCVDEDIEHIPIRIRKPSGSVLTRKLPVFIFYHGGAYIIGDRYSHDKMLQEISLDLDMIVISVSYRLAPVHLWPAQLDDTFRVAKHFLDNAADYGIDPARVAFGGDSAGAHLTAAVTLKLAVEDFPVLPKAQVLIYPVCQFMDFRLPSHVQNSDGPVLTREMVLFSVSNLLLGNDSIVHAIEKNTHVSEAFVESNRPRVDHGSVPESLRHAPYNGHIPDAKGGDEDVWNKIKDAMTSPYFNVLFSNDLSKQPTTFMFTAQHDPLRDDGILYAKALREAGVSVTHLNHPKGVHGMRRFYQSTPEGREFYEAMINFLIQTL